MGTYNLVGTAYNVDNCLVRGIAGTSFFLKEDNGLTYYVRVRGNNMHTNKPKEGTRVSVWCYQIERILGQFCVEASALVEPSI